MAEKYQSREERRKQQTTKTKPQGKKKTSGTFKRVFLILIALGIVGMLAGAATFAYLVKDTPKLNEKELKDPISSQIFDKNGKYITDIGTVKRDYVDYEDIPKLVENSFLATEDVRFYKHNGIDVIRLGGAVIANVTDGFGSEGASTLTQQVVKNAFLTTDKTISRKAQEAWLAFQLERKYTKQEIFEMYVNKIWMSQGGHGVATASKVFFGKDLDQLKLHEAALLAGMPQSPANYDPFKNPEKSEKRRNIVLSLMHQHGFISKEEMEKAQDIPVENSLVKKKDRKTTNDIPYDQFIGQVIKEVKKKYKEFDVYSDGLKIYTTIDIDTQKYVEKMMNSNDIVQFPDKKFQAGITLLDTKTGEIRALGGNRNQKDDFVFNYATDSKRQPGSTIKPILDYGPAIEHLKWGTYQALEDKPYTYSDGTKINNWDNRHMGVMSMREALGRSRNIPALQALQAVGLDKSKDFASGIGIKLDEIYESYAVGGLKEGLSSLQVAGAYSAFGNNGFYTEPHAVKEIELRDGTKLNMSPKPEVAMKDYTAFMITDMLKSVVNSPYGTGTMANVPGLPIAGKTGTTNYPEDIRNKYGIPVGAVPDAWFAGYTTQYTAAVWTGYENQTKNYLIGTEQKIAQLLFKNLMAHVSSGEQTADFTVPKSVEKVQIEKGTFPAKLASEFTPSDRVITEYAVRGNVPTEVSQKYDKLSAPTNLNAEFDEEANAVVLSWEHDAETDKEVRFDVTVSLNGGAEETLSSATQKGLIMNAPQPGATYTFKVIAISEDQQSDAATATIQVPDPSQVEDDQENPQDDGTTEDNPDDQGNGNSGNGNGNGNGQGNGNGNGNGNGTGNGNGNRDEDDEENEDEPDEEETDENENSGDGA